MKIHDLIIVFVGFLSETIGTISGFGSSTYFVPVALFFEKFTFVIIITALLHTFSNFFKIYFFKGNFNKELFLKMAIPSVMACGAGALIITQIDINLIKLILGIFLVFFSIFAYLNLASKHVLTSGQIMVLSSLSGFLTGFIGTGGALRGIALSALKLPKESFVFLSSSIDAAGDLLRLILYLYKGFMEWEQWYYIPLLLIGALIGTLIGKKILARIPQQVFEKIILLFTLISGALLMMNSMK